MAPVGRRPPGTPARWGRRRPPRSASIPAALRVARLPLRVGGGGCVSAEPAGRRAPRPSRGRGGGHSSPAAPAYSQEHGQGEYVFTIPRAEPINGAQAGATYPRFRLSHSPSRPRPGRRLLWSAGTGRRLRPRDAHVAGLPGAARPGSARPRSTSPSAETGLGRLGRRASAAHRPQFHLVNDGYAASRPSSSAPRSRKSGKTIRRERRATR